VRQRDHGALPLGVVAVQRCVQIGEHKKPENRFSGLDLNQRFLLQSTNAGKGQ